MRVRVVLLLVFLAVASFAMWPQTSLGEDRSFTVNGIVDCGRRDGQACRLGDTLTLITADLGGANITIDITWIRDSLPPLDQGDGVCIEVSGSGGSYQGVGVVPCQSSDKSKAPKEKERAAATATPTATSTSAPEIKRPTISIAVVESEPEPDAILPRGVFWSAAPGAMQPLIGTLEGDDIEFEITLSFPVNETVTVQYATQEIAGQAREGISCPVQIGVQIADYERTVGTATFPPQTTSVSVFVPTCPDLDEEEPETMRMVLSSPSSNATLGVSSAVGTILDESICLCLAPEASVRREENGEGR